ncbi:LysM peptidoglycan-binding domain-containing protein [Shewanella sp. NFH-SH190041]|uniref:LysM peptidoglycan-binding domain-containing protein n=1 Tax=Shewanella sp. NFH-SH190041 TaxID=2950245 RepID=UPI0021C3F8B1|nr:LysM peptidoglycan-binding domain-containing protein [Shewanella sp. NFH-SH190041]
MDGLMKRIFLPLMLGGALLVQSAAGVADTLTLKAGHPDTYLVKKGDTLWDISAHFLDDPWRWPTLWGANPQIANPHLIYPGDRLTLVFINGEPRLVVKPLVRQSPQGRIQPKTGAVPVVDLALIRPYLIQNRVVAPDWLASQPVVLGGESPSRHHIAGDIIYVQGALTAGTKVGLYTGGRVFSRQQDGEVLGQEAILTAAGQVVSSGEISKVKLLTSYRESKAGNRILSIDDSALLPIYFMPRAAQVSTPAHVLASGIDIREMGKLDVVYLDRGAIDGVTAGDVFAVHRPGDTVVFNHDNQPVSSLERSRYENMLAAVSDTSIQLPPIYHGQIMVFKTFERTSLGLIMVNERPVRVHDKLSSPQPPLLGE